MMKVKYFMTAALSGAFLSFGGYLIFIALEGREYDFLWATGTTAVGFCLGISTILFLKKKQPKIYYSPSLSIWTVIFINFNLFFGIMLGLIAGICAQWILLLLFSAIFGHPESTNWGSGLSCAFGFIGFVIFTVSILSISCWCFMSGLKYLESKFKI